MSDSPYRQRVELDPSKTRAEQMRLAAERLKIMNAGKKMKKAPTAFDDAVKRYTAHVRQAGGFTDEISNRLYKDDLYQMAKQHGLPATRKHKKHELHQMLSRR